MVSGPGGEATLNRPSEVPSLAVYHPGGLVLDGGSVNYRLEVLYRIQYALGEQNRCGPRRRSIRFPLGLEKTQARQRGPTRARLSATLPLCAVEREASENVTSKAPDSDSLAERCYSGRAVFGVLILSSDFLELFAAFAV